MIELIRTPSERYQHQQQPDARYLGRLRCKYEYLTSDGRWLIQEAAIRCGGKWDVIDTTGQVYAEHTADWPMKDRYATTFQTLAAAKAFISEPHSNSYRKGQ